MVRKQKPSHATPPPFRPPQGARTRETCCDVTGGEWGVRGGARGSEVSATNNHRRTDSVNEAAEWPSSLHGQE